MKATTQRGRRSLTVASTSRTGADRGQPRRDDGKAHRRGGRRGTRPRARRRHGGVLEHEGASPETRHGHTRSSRRRPRSGPPVVGEQPGRPGSPARRSPNPSGSVDSACLRIGARASGRRARAPRNGSSGDDDRDGSSRAPFELQRAPPPLGRPSDQERDARGCGGRRAMSAVSNSWVASREAIETASRCPRRVPRRTQ